MEQQSTKEHCLSQMASSWRELLDVIERIPKDELDTPNVVGDWAVRDLLAHFAGYDRYVAAQVFATLDQRAATTQEAYGRADAPPEAADADEDLFNAWLVEHARRIPLEAVVEEFTWAHQRLVAAAEACSEAAFDDRHRFTALDGRSLADVIKGDCWGHHRQHLPDLIEGVDRLAEG